MTTTYVCHANDFEVDGVTVVDCDWCEYAQVRDLRFITRKYLTYAYRYNETDHDPQRIQSVDNPGEQPYKTTHDHARLFHQNNWLAHEECC